MAVGSDSFDSNNDDFLTEVQPAATARGKLPARHKRLSADTFFSPIETPRSKPRRTQPDPRTKAQALPIRLQTPDLPHTSTPPSSGFPVQKSSARMIRNPKGGGGLNGTGPTSLRRSPAPTPAVVANSIKRVQIDDDDEWTKTDGASHGRIYCMVVSMWLGPDSVEQQRWDDITDTWGKRCDVLTFFIDAQSNAGCTRWTTASNNTAKVVAVNTVRPLMCNGKPCGDLFHKVGLAFRYVAANEIDKADWFVKLDTDTFLFPEGIRAHVKRKGYLPTEPHYFGHILYHVRYVNMSCMRRCVCRFLVSDCACSGTALVRALAPLNDFGATIPSPKTAHIPSQVQCTR
jgi:hypothetical protein